MILSIEDGMQFVIETVMKPLNAKGYDKYWCIYNPELGKNNSAGIVGYGKTTADALHDLAFAIKRRNLDKPPKKPTPYTIS